MYPFVVCNTTHDFFFFLCSLFDARKGTKENNRIALRLLFIDNDLRLLALPWASGLLYQIPCSWGAQPSISQSSLTTSVRAPLEQLDLLMKKTSSVVHGGQ